VSTRHHLDVLPPSENAVTASIPFLDEPLSDEELCRLALAADPNAPLSDEAIPLSLHLTQFARSGTSGLVHGTSDGSKRSTLADACRRGHHLGLLTH
jgi:hypothetical protein